MGTQLNRCQTREHVYNFMNSEHITNQFPDVKKTQQMADAIRSKLEDTSEGSLEHTKQLHQTTLSKSLTMLLQKKELSSFKTTGVSDEITKLQAHCEFVKKQFKQLKKDKDYKGLE